MGRGLPSQYCRLISCGTPQSHRTQPGVIPQLKERKGDKKNYETKIEGYMILAVT